MAEARSLQDKAGQHTGGGPAVAVCTFKLDTEPLRVAQVLTSRQVLDCPLLPTGLPAAALGAHACGGRAF